MNGDRSDLIYLYGSDEEEGASEGFSGIESPREEQAGGGGDSELRGFWARSAGARLLPPP